MIVVDFNSLINFGQIIFMETLKRPPLFIRVAYSVILERMYYMPL